MKNTTDSIERLSATDGSPPWIPCTERMPTEADGSTYGESQGHVLWLAPYRPLVAAWNDKVSQQVNKVTHWMRLPSEPIDPFFAWRAKYFLCHPSIDHAREAWNAAREGND